MERFERSCHRCLTMKPIGVSEWSVFGEPTSCMSFIRKLNYKWNSVRHPSRNGCAIGDTSSKIISPQVGEQFHSTDREFQWKLNACPELPKWAVSSLLDTPPLYPSPKKLFSLVNLATLGVHSLLYGSEIDACTRDSVLVTADYEQDNQGPSNLSPTTKSKKKQTFVEIKVVYAKNMLDLHTST